MVLQLKGNKIVIKTQKDIQEMQSKIAQIQMQYESFSVFALITIINEEIVDKIHLFAFYYWGKMSLGLSCCGWRCQNSVCSSAILNHYSICKSRIWILVCGFYLKEKLFPSMIIFESKMSG